MKSKKKCGKILSVICFIVLMFIFYLYVMTFLQGGVTIGRDEPQVLDRYLHDGRQPRDDNEKRDDVGTEDWDDASDDDDNDSQTKEPLDKWDKWDDTEESRSGDNSPGGSEIQKVGVERVMKIFDFNHRKCCPLNYSFHNCEYSACVFTDKSEEADLVMINGARLKALRLPPRQKGQLWMMYTKEPPTFRRFNFLAREDFRDQINWTRCIFRDSTFRGHYGALESRPPPEKDYGKIYAQKRYEAAWFVSNCNSQSHRNEYVNRMLSEVDVHIFGLCGNRTCGRHGLRLNLYGSKDPCLTQVSEDYKFYLSFENAMCSDYVTEKFYKLYEDVDVIPVVRGGANYNELAPGGSYVNAKDFHSPEELGRFLRQLSKNKQKYIRMLKLKNGFINTFPKPRYPCELCKALHTRRHEPATYRDIAAWVKGHCWEPNDL